MNHSHHLNKVGQAVYSDFIFHTIRSIEPLEDFRLQVCFVTGETKLYDVNPLIEKWSSFEPLSCVAGLWNQVKVDSGGYGISWNDDIDLSCDELYLNGVDC